MASKGYVLWRGPSRWDGKPIVVIATTKSSNRKTGKMMQTWILREDVPPHKATASGADESICGSCPHRNPRTCYVVEVQAPLAVWRAYHRGAYQEIKHPGFPTHSIALRNIGAGESIRLGAYGDPAMVPFHVWQNLTSHAANWTGYTHRWSDIGASPAYRALLMASVDSPTEARAAWDKGWRTFRAGYDVDPAKGLEIHCPAAPEGGERVQCIDCGLCRGASRQARSIAINLHGSRVKRKPLPTAL